MNELQALYELRERLDRAAQRLSAMNPGDWRGGSDRLSGKVEGVLLAISYLDELLRTRS